MQPRIKLGFVVLYDLTLFKANKYEKSCTCIIFFYLSLNPRYDICSQNYLIHRYYTEAYRIHSIQRSIGRQFRLGNTFFKLSRLYSMTVLLYRQCFIGWLTGNCYDWGVISRSLLISAYKYRTGARRLLEGATASML